MYSVQSYGRMICDTPRMEAYAAALRRTVRPGAVVVDIGTGTGIFSLLACQLGARRVFAIEPDDVIEVARETARANGFEERITFIQGLSTRVELPERADVIVSDIRGCLPLYARHLPVIADARRRFLAPGGALVPCRDEIWAALVECPDVYEPFQMPWAENPFALDLRPARRFVCNAWDRAKLKPEHLLTEPRRWATLDYTVIESAHVAGEMAWTMSRNGTGHGMALWFDATLADGIGYSNAPDRPEMVYGRAFFPWLEPVALAAGDQVAVALKANLVGKLYIWSWDTTVRDAAGAAKASFRQSTFFGSPLNTAKLRRRLVDQFILDQIDGQTSLEQIAERALTHFPERFAHQAEALGRVGELSVNSRAA